MRKSKRNIIWLLLYGAWVGLVVLLLGSCQAGQATITPEQQARLDALLESHRFRFEAEYAMPLASQAYISAANLGFTQARGNSVTRINLVGDGYFLAVSGDSTQSFLPYFGIRDNVTDYAGRGGIELDGPITDQQTRRTPKGYELEFKSKDEYEQFRILLFIMPSLEAQVSVFSPQRDVIRFSGKIRPEDE